LKKHFYILAIAISIISLQSCVDSIPVPIEEVDAKLKFESKIGAFRGGFSAKISTTTGFSDIDAISHPEDVDVRITWVGAVSVDDFVQLYFDETCECYTNTEEKPDPSFRYILNAYIPNSDIYEPIKAYMKIPNVNRIESVEAIRDTTDGITSLTSTLQLKESVNQYYHIIPYRRGTDIVINSDGEEEEVYNDYREYLDFVDSENHELHFEQLHNQPGFLVDFGQQTESENPLSLSLISSDIIDYESEAFTKIFYEIRSVTESYYEYEKYLSRELKRIEIGVGDPPIAYSNIIDGLGYFGGYSVVQDSIPVQ